MYRLRDVAWMIYVIEFDDWGGDKHMGLPYVIDAANLVFTNKKGEKIDWSTPIPTEELNGKWIRIGAMAYLRSFESRKVLVYCVSLYDASTKTWNRKGYIYHRPSLEPIKKLEIGAKVHLELKPSRYSLYATHYALRDDKEPKPVGNEVVKQI